MSISYLKEAVPAAQVAKDLAAVKETVTGVFLGHKAKRQLFWLAEALDNR
jgi:hypothetical protein